MQQGQLQLIPVVLAGLLGTVLGALPWYGIGRLNEERIEQFGRHGRWIGISPDELARSRRWFNRYGTALVFWGRLVPGIRTLISVLAGIEMMPMAPFLVWTTVGSLIWTLLPRSPAWCSARVTATLKSGSTRFQKWSRCCWWSQHWRS